MKTLTVRLPESLVAEIETESRGRGISKSDIVRERLQHAHAETLHAPLQAIQDLVGSLGHLPPDLSARKKDHLRATGYGGKRPR